jgi:hypothetical protein
MTTAAWLDAKNEGWSERRKASIVLESPDSVDKRVAKFCGLPGRPAS